MIKDKQQIERIRTAFEDMQSREDLLKLLNEVKPLVYGGNVVPFELKQITWYANPKLNRKRYSEFKIKKKSGSERSIHAPVKGLKAIQKTLSVIFQCVFEPHIAAMGFVPCRSIVDNARLHEGSNYVYNIDLKDFFQSIDQARVWKCLQLKPFNLLDTFGTVRKSEPIETITLSRILENLNTEEIGFRFVKFNEIEYLHLVIEGRGYLTIKIGERVVLNETETIARVRELNENYIIYHGETGNGIGHWFTFGPIISSDKKGKNEISSSRKDIANIVAAICCTEIEVERKTEAGGWEKVKRNVLPQGAPTSPVITNIICQRLDFILSGVAKRFGLLYSRYADDITFSSMHNVYQPGSDFLKELQRIILEQGFHINESKTRLQKSGYRKEVTGLLVNEKVNVQQRYIKQLRVWLYYWERYGYERAADYFLRQYNADKGHLKKSKPDISNVIAGKLDYLKMVKGNENQLYLKLQGRFEKLINLENKINKLLDIWENEGINIAMELHYQNIGTNEQI